MKPWIPLALALAIALPAWADGDVVLVQSTTSTQNSGLYDHLLPLASEAIGQEIRVVAVGTGQALRNAERCDGDLLITHARAAEEAFVAANFGTARYDLMYNDFILIGPEENPAGLTLTESVYQALSRISDSQSPFLSRGDDSGTHKAERRLWQGIVDVASASGGWYREAGAGMGTTLNIAIGMGAYTLTDRASWMGFENRGNHVIWAEGDEALFNQYGVIAVHPEHCPNVNIEGAEALRDWLLGPGQEAIAAFRLEGAQVFFPNAR